MKKSLKGTWSINDVNNVEGADRKLSINGVLEFWVHDDALSQNSEYFKELFGIVFIDNHIQKKKKVSQYSQSKTKKIKPINSLI